jgi:hypothetical protein
MKAGQQKRFKANMIKQNYVKLVQKFSGIARTTIEAVGKQISGRHMVNM